jgi:hypothetical protein
LIASVEVSPTEHALGIEPDDDPAAMNDGRLAT